MKKRYIFLTVALVLVGFACFLKPSFNLSRDWALFSLFFILVVGLTLGFQVRRRPKKLSSHDELLDALQEGVIVINSQGQIIKINKQVEHLFNASKKEVLGKALTSIELFEKHQGMWRPGFKKGSTQSFTFCFDETGKKGCDVVMKPFGKGGNFVLTLRDNLGQYQKHQLGKDFVANASHELRTPITIIKGFAETIHDLPEISGAMLEDFTEKIVRNCHRMEKLVKNLLTLADLDYLPKARLQECDLVGLVDNCSYTLLALHPKVRIEALHSEEIITILADPDLLELALMNLLENAAKYSDDHPLIRVTIENSLEEVYLTVEDKGVGIPQIDLERIFDRFYTVNKAHSRKLGGAGLGLSIVKVIIGKHDGTIDVTSKEGEGTQFRLTFQKLTTQPAL